MPGACLPLARLTPIDVRWEEGRPVVRWCDFGDLAFVEPFLRQTYAKVLEANPGRAIAESGIDAAKEAAAGALKPAGFIFHSSRCGSTLVSRLLASSQQVLMVAEPAAVYRLLEGAQAVDVARRCDWLRDLVLALGRPRRPTEQHYVVKLSSVLTAHLPTFQRAFPDVPWIFVYRRPVEVMVSAIGSSTGWFPALRAEPARATPLLGLAPDELAAAADGELAARVLARIYAAALAARELAPERCRYVEHPELPRAIWTRIAPFFGLQLTVAERRAMRLLARFHAKDPAAESVFKRDSRLKARRAGSVMRAQAAYWVDPLYRQLRQGGRAGSLPSGHDPDAALKV